MRTFWNRNRVDSRFLGALMVKTSFSSMSPNFEGSMTGVFSIESITMSVSARLSLLSTIRIAIISIGKRLGAVPCALSSFRMFSSSSLYLLSLCSGVSRKLDRSSDSFSCDCRSRTIAMKCWSIKRSFMALLRR